MGDDAPMTMIPYKGRARSPSYDPRIALALEVQRVTRSASLAAASPVLVQRSRADIPLSLSKRSAVNSGVFGGGTFGGNVGGGGTGGGDYES